MTSALCHIPLGSVPVDSARFGEGLGSILLDDLECDGSEDTLTNCSRKGNIMLFETNCDHGEDAGVICQGELTLQTVTQSMYC